MTASTVCLDPKNGEFTIDPTDFEEGRDLRLVKARKGEFADWCNCGFSSKARAWNAAERGAKDDYGLLNLADLIPPAPEKAIAHAHLPDVRGQHRLLPFDRVQVPMARVAEPVRKAPQQVPGATRCRSGPEQRHRRLRAEDAAAHKATTQATMDQLRMKNRATRTPTTMRRSTPRPKPPRRPPTSPRLPAPAFSPAREPIQSV